MGEDPNCKELSHRPPRGTAGRDTGGVPVAEKLYAILHTNHGPIRLQLFPDHAPATVRNFVELAEGTKDYTDPRTGQKGDGPYYDGTISHRVIAGFMVQLGDPTGTGRGGPGFQFADEFHPELQFDRPYLLAMANAGPERFAVLHHGGADPAPEPPAHHLRPGCRRAVRQGGGLDRDDPDRPGRPSARGCRGRARGDRARRRLTVPLEV